MPYGYDAIALMQTEDLREMLEEGEVVVGDGATGKRIHVSYNGETPCPNPYCEDGTLRYENIEEYGYPFADCDDCGLSMDFTDGKSVLKPDPADARDEQRDAQEGERV